MKNGKELLSEQQEELISVLRNRFIKNPNRHKTIE